LHRAIADRRLPPGTKLAEEHLAQVFGVSRARTRTVLQTLARQNIVTLEPNRGAFVSRPSPDEARHVFAARKLVETALAHLVIAAIDTKVLAKLRRHVAEEKRIEHGPDRDRFLKNSHDFHMLLAELVRNPVLEAFLGELLARSALITAIYERRTGGHLCSHAGHQRLIDILERRDASAFAKAMLEHLDEVEANLDLTVSDPQPIDLRAVFTGQPDKPAPIKATRQRK
jgi:DNA-binding GntR family transcriptional regulator